MQQVKVKIQEEIISLALFFLINQKIKVLFYLGGSPKIASFVQIKIMIEHLYFIGSPNKQTTTKLSVIGVSLFFQFQLAT